MLLWTRVEETARRPQLRAFLHRRHLDSLLRLRQGSLPPQPKHLKTRSRSLLDGIVHRAKPTPTMAKVLQEDDAFSPGLEPG